MTETICSFHSCNYTVVNSSGPYIKAACSACVDALALSKSYERGKEADPRESATSGEPELQNPGLAPLLATTLLAIVVVARCLKTLEIRGNPELNSVSASASPLAHLC